MTENIYSPILPLAMSKSTTPVKAKTSTTGAQKSSVTETPRTSIRFASTIPTPEKTYDKIPQATSKATEKNGSARVSTSQSPKQSISKVQRTPEESQTSENTGRRSKSMSKDIGKLKPSVSTQSIEHAIYSHQYVNEMNTGSSSTLETEVPEAARSNIEFLASTQSSYRDPIDVRLSVKLEDENRGKARESQSKSGKEKGPKT